MIEMPPEVVIDVITSPCICFFKDTKFKDDAPPHFYIIIPVNEASDLILSMITSKISSRVKYYSNTNKPEAVNSLVKINKETFSFLTRESVVECNQAEVIPKGQMKNKIDKEHGFSFKAPEIPILLLEEIKEAIRSSPLVSNYIKKLL